MLESALDQYVMKILSYPQYTLLFPLLLMNFDVASNAHVKHI